MAPRKRSDMWNHFIEFESSKAKCGYCSKILSVAGGSFGNLSRHLKTVHPAVILSKASVAVHIDDNLEDDPAEHGIWNCFNIIIFLQLKFMNFNSNSLCNITVNTSLLLE